MKGGPLPELSLTAICASVQTDIGQPILVKNVAASFRVSQRRSSRPSACDNVIPAIANSPSENDAF
jgi:hypothetical protein